MIRQEFISKMNNLLEEFGDSPAYNPELGDFWEWQDMFTWFLENKLDEDGNEI